MATALRVVRGEPPVLEGVATWWLLRIRLRALALADHTLLVIDCQRGCGPRLRPAVEGRLIVLLVRALELCVVTNTELQLLIHRTLIAQVICYLRLVVTEVGDIDVPLVGHRCVTAIDVGVRWVGTEDVESASLLLSMLLALLPGRLSEAL